MYTSLTILRTHYSFIQFKEVGVQWVDFSLLLMKDITHSCIIGDPAFGGISKPALTFSLLMTDDTWTPTNSTTTSYSYTMQILHYKHSKLSTTRYFFLFTYSVSPNSKLTLQHFTKFQKAKAGKRFRGLLAQIFLYTATQLSLLFTYKLTLQYFTKLQKTKAKEIISPNAPLIIAITFTSPWKHTQTHTR